MPIIAKMPLAAMIGLKIGAGVAVLRPVALPKTKPIMAVVVLVVNESIAIGQVSVVLIGCATLLPTNVRRPPAARIRA
jgi:hypothetical protein